MNNKWYTEINTADFYPTIKNAEFQSYIAHCLLQKRDDVKFSYNKPNLK